MRTANAGATPPVPPCPPPHVHVIGPEGEAGFRLNCPDGPLELREEYGLPQRLLRAIRARLAESLQDLCDQWEAFHGLA